MSPALHHSAIDVEARRRLRQIASREDIDIDYVEYQGMFHGWILMQRLPEARQATATLLALLSGGSRGEP